MAEQLQVPFEQQDAFVRFARGVMLGDQIGLDVLASGIQPLRRSYPQEGQELEAGHELDGPRDGFPHNIPAQSTPFFGRGAELELLVEFLADSQKRLVTVLGPGGMGKTRLALAVAEKQLSGLEGQRRFKEGIYFVPLAGLESAENLLPAIAESLAFQFSGADDQQAQLLRYLQRRRVLIILDNFEHLLKGIGLVQAILEACPSVTLLATSRERLKLRSEQLFPIHGLTYPAQKETVPLEMAATYSAVHLFLERSKSVRPSFKMSEENVNHITTICRRVGGMPLAIVLAAAWIDTLTVKEIVHEIGHNLDILETEQRDMPARQRSLRAAFTYSWRMLSPNKQEVFRKLSVFRGGFDSEAAEAVAKASFRDLQALVNKSLITRSPAAGQFGARYGIHEMLRQFAEGELGHLPEQKTEVRDRHSVYFLTLLQKQESRWHTGYQLETLATIAWESDNITAGWRWALATESWASLAEAIDSWGSYHLWKGLYTDGSLFCSDIESRLERLIASSAISPAVCTDLWVKALAWQGTFLSKTADALAKLKRGLAYLNGQDLNDGQFDDIKAFILRRMSWQLTPIAIHEAHKCAEEALHYSQQLDEEWQAAESHYYLGLLNWRLGSLSEARENIEISLATSLDNGDSRMQVMAGIILAWIVQIEGDLGTAERLRKETMDLCQSIGDRPYLIHCTGDLATTLGLRGKLNEGLIATQRCVALSVEYGFRDKEGYARSTLSRAHMHLGDYESAGREVERALELVKETGNLDVETSLWSLLGCLALVSGDNGVEAQAFFETSLRLNDEVQDQIFLGDKMAGLLLATCQVGDGEQARLQAVANLEHVIRIGHFEQLTKTLASVAFYLARFGNVQEALAVWGIANADPLVAASKWFEDVIGREMEALADNQRSRSSTVIPDHDRWQTAQMLLDLLQ